MAQLAALRRYEKHLSYVHYSKVLISPGAKALTTLEEIYNETHKRPATFSYNCAQCVYDFLAVIAREYYSDLAERDKEEKHKAALKEKKSARIAKTKQDGNKNKKGNALP